MKMLLFMLVFAIAISAQSQSVPCGSSSTVAAGPISSGTTTSSSADRAVMEPPPKDPAAEPAGPSTKPRPHVGTVAPQIKLRRPAPTQPSSACRCGTLGASSLTAPSNSQEIPILTGLAGTFRFDHVLVQETTRFSSDSVVSLVVGVGRANFGADVVSPFPLKSDSAPYDFRYERPTPPQLTGAYDLVLNFKASSPLGDGDASHFSSGTLTWEVCGSNAQ
jgi:hypothetical protein